MADPAEGQQKSINVPWATIAAVLAAAGGFFLYLNPLQTSRPNEQTGSHTNPDRLQDADARLWQDPLRSTSEHDAEIQWKAKEMQGKGQDTSKEAGDKQGAAAEEKHHQVETLRDAIRKCEAPQILAVMIPGGSYAEYTEIRLRMRQAVLEGIAEAKGVPVDGEHIGYVKINRPDKPSWGWHDMIVPFEACRFAFDYDRVIDHPIDRIWVIWLRDEEFQTEPLSQLDSLLRELTQALELEPKTIKTSIVGPRSSTTLRAMVAEAARFGNESPKLLENVDMWNATATASDELLLHGVMSPEAEIKTVDGILGSKLKGGFTFHRSTLTDREVMDVLVDELQNNRRIKVCPDDKGETDHVALISEWDTFFGRALPVTFEHAVFDSNTLDDVINGIPGSNILTFHYLRGIDGALPAGGKTNDKAKETEQPKTSRPREPTEGFNQGDYLRRLANELADRDEEFRREDRGRIKAVGVLGSDVYDKLMVLEALRHALPDATFFTNDLDARLAHPDEWRWTRNLLVASRFGLTFDRDLANRQKVPPFRDSNQTAVYLATLRALGVTGAESTAALEPVRLYEIGRRGAFELTTAEPSASQPGSTDMRPWYNPRRLEWSVAILVVAGAAGTWLLYLMRIQFNANSKSSHKRDSNTNHKSIWLSSWFMFAALALTSLVSVWIIAVMIPIPVLEPYSWLDGISVWPTETFRMMALLISAFYVIKTSKLLHRDEEDIEKRFGFTSSHPDSFREFFTSCRKSAESIGRTLMACWRRLLGRMTLREWRDAVTPKTVEPAKLWNAYVKSGEGCPRWARLMPFIVLYILAGIFLMKLFGIPAIPARGDWAIYWNMALFILSMLAAGILTFYVVDATHLNRRLVECLTSKTTEWSGKAIENLWERLSFNKTMGEVPRHELFADYLDIDLIACRTDVVGGLIYYPFIVISFLIISRASIFDYWTWPLPILIIIGLNAGAAFSAGYLRWTAEHARQRALRRLNERLIGYIAAGRGWGREAKIIREMSNLIRTEDRGAFAAISQHPLLRALLLPSGSAGIWALFQYFPRFLSG